MTTVEKITVRFGRPGLGTVTVQGGGWAGIPGELIGRGAAQIPPGVLVENDPDETSQTILTPGRHATSGAIRAISIAPDSPIESVDLSIGDNGRWHRIGVGCPFIGDIPENSFVRVVPIRSTPAIHRYSTSWIPTFQQFQDWAVAWDMTQIEKIAAGTFGFAADVAAPMPAVKLNLYRGDVAHISAMIKRAPYVGEMEWKLSQYGIQPEPPAAKILTNPVLIMIVDGRRRIRVVANRQTVADGGAPANLAVYGIESYKTKSGISPAAASRLLDFPTFDEILASTAIPNNVSQPLIFDYTPTTNPYYAIACRIMSDDVTGDINLGPAGGGAGGSIDAKGFLRVTAWDD